MNLLELLGHIVRHPLNRAGKAAAVARLVRWQLASRILAQPVVLPFVNNTRLLVLRGMTGATGNWYGGLHECADMAFVLHALRPGDLFVDVGANVGSYTVLAAGAVQADAIAVEPVEAPLLARGLVGLRQGAAKQAIAILARDVFGIGGLIGSRSSGRRRCGGLGRGAALPPEQPRRGEQQRADSAQNDAVHLPIPLNE